MTGRKLETRNGWILVKKIDGEFNIDLSSWEVMLDSREGNLKKGDIIWTLPDIQIRSFRHGDSFLSLIPVHTVLIVERENETDHA